ncbi:Hypothetical predicted protein [Paramuricea clavata]|uniref:Uncharacterized protein n=1 Tax=Paramuricea clavata TaxID=317549 RepID=A0A6S7K3P6_PARCT|nr:Hypothetical predicted protein [Paramuricea clavata]
MATYYDLLRDENDSFYVQFDTPTPRPHFIILPKKQAGIERDFSQMTPEQRKKLMEAVQSMMSSFKVPSGILSIHRGSWLSRNTKGFLAHICVDVELYLHVFEQQKSIIPTWPNKTYVTGEWKVNDDPKSYPQNVRGYIYRHSRYLDEEVAAIWKLMFVPRPIFRELDEPDISVIQHPSHPKIGLVGKKIPLEELVWTIENFAQKLGLTNRRSNDGCNVCLHLGLVSTEDWKHDCETGKEIFGYIVTCGPRFYRLCPLGVRKKWFAAFRQSKFACLT